MNLNKLRQKILFANNKNIENKFSLYELYQAILFNNGFKEDTSLYHLSTWSYLFKPLPVTIQIDYLYLKFWNIFSWGLDSKSFYHMNATIYIKSNGQCVKIGRCYTENRKIPDNLDLLIQKDYKYTFFELVNDSPLNADDIIKIFNNIIDEYKINLKKYQEDKELKAQEIKAKNDNNRKVLFEQIKSMK